VAAKAKLLECHDQETEESFHHRENPTRRFTFGPHGTPAAAGATGAAEDGHMGNASAEAATAAAGGAAATGAKVAAEAESVTDGAPSSQRPKPAN